jgi:S-(hydroxymethyl)glutathione dehydrogenase / alcohol dehydrogenase
VTIGTRNCRLTALRSFFRFVGDREPLVLSQCAEVLRIPTKKAPTSEVHHLDVVSHLVGLTDGRADYTFDCTRNTTVMRQAPQACQRSGRLGRDRGRASRQGDFNAALSACHRIVWKGSAFGGARGRTDVPKIVDWYMNGKIQTDPIITRVLTLGEINKGFELMHEGKSIRSVVVL